jgi:uncharacterized protein GlcG (DUF336 family)
VRAQAAPVTNLSSSVVETLLDRAAAASSSRDGIIAVVDRAGNILGVRIEKDVDPALLADPVTKSFAIDGAIAKARTGAFFANSQAPLTSRTIQLISQSTMTERVIESNPNIPIPDSTQRGPGFVAPVGPKGHFPPGVAFTPQVDLFLIEHTNRDSIENPGPDRIKGTADDIILPSRFNVDPAFIPAGVVLSAPESYGYVTGLLDNPAIQLATSSGGTQAANPAQARGIATLPGGIPIIAINKTNGRTQPVVLGGIGVFFPGKTGYATEENSNLNGAGFYDPSKPDRALEAEFIAFKAVGGSKSAGVPFGPAPFGTIPGYTLPFGRIDLVGITLDLVGGHGLQGVRNLLNYGRHVQPGSADDGYDVPVNRAGDLYLEGQGVPTGWLVTPHAGSGLTAQDVEDIINRGVAEALQIRAAIRLPLDSTTRMVFSVTDLDGNVLGLYRMSDATIFSIDVAVAKARNVAYYADPTALQPQDRLPQVPLGTAFTSRTFRYLTLPRFPEGIANNAPGPFSTLNDPGVLRTGRVSVSLPPASYVSVQGYDAFYPATNFHDPENIANQNGVVFFPGSTPLYKDLDGDGVRELVGGLGVSGDGVDQDDDVTYVAAQGYTNPASIPRADQVKVRDVRLPFIKFNRQPKVPRDQAPLGPQKFGRLPAPRPKSHA